MSFPIASPRCSFEEYSPRSRLLLMTAALVEVPFLFLVLVFLVVLFAGSLAPSGRRAGFVAHLLLFAFRAAMIGIPDDSESR